MLLVSTLFACKDEVKSVVNHPVNPEVVPTVVSHDMQTVISDSGNTRYRITTPLWNMYEEAKEPHWTFPQGVFAEELDKKFKVVATIQCDSAHYNERQKIWSLNGNVRITNIKKEIILTKQMFWDQNQHTLQSDSFIHIEDPMRVIEGYGYSSNEKLTSYTLKHVSAIFPIEEGRFPRGGSGAAPVQQQPAAQSTAQGSQSAKQPDKPTSSQ